jgi:hypothetical protein
LGTRGQKEGSSSAQKGTPAMRVNLHRSPSGPVSPLSHIPPAQPSHKVSWTFYGIRSGLDLKFLWIYREGTKSEDLQIKANEKQQPRYIRELSITVTKFPR